VNRTTAGVCLAALALLTGSAPAQAWGPEGHEIVALIAQQRMAPATRAAVAHLLASDRDPLTAHDIASEATWADAYRDSGADRDDRGYHRTAPWHYVDLELHRPDLDWACWGRKPLPVATPASRGPGRDCVIDKIGQFQAELASPATAPQERLLALKFLLHLVGDLHQPLHAADDHDHGGNDVRVSGLGRRVERLHHAWDTTFVRDLGRDPSAVAAQLDRHITDGQRRRWCAGTPTDWAWQSWRLARDDAYGRLPGGRGVQHLDRSYRDHADAIVARQLSAAGVRLAWLLDRALGQAHY